MFACLIGLRRRAAARWLPVRLEAANGGRCRVRPRGARDRRCRADVPRYPIGAGVMASLGLVLVAVGLASA
jgi:hypothetical protein